jgi:hypothetical protein
MSAYGTFSQPAVVPHLNSAPEYTSDFIAHLEHDTDEDSSGDSATIPSMAELGISAFDEPSDAPHSVHIDNANQKLTPEDPKDDEDDELLEVSEEERRRIVELFSTCDANNDGVIDRDEFFKMIRGLRNSHFMSGISDRIFNKFVEANWNAMVRPCKWLLRPNHPPSSFRWMYLLL